MTEVWFASFNKCGGWSIQKTTQDTFDWLMSLDPCDRGYFRVYKLRPGRNLHEAKSRLHWVMRFRYNVLPI